MSGGSTTRTEPWAEQKPYLTKGFEEAGRLYEKGAPNFYPGQTLAGFNPAQQLAQRSAINYATGPRAGAQQAAAEKALIGGLSGGINTDVFLPMMGQMGQQVKGQLQNTILPGIRESLTRYQPGGSSRGDLVQNKAITSAVNQGLVNKAAEMYGSSYEAAQDRVPQYAQQYQSIMGAPLGMYDAIGDVGAQQRALQQEGLNQQQRAYEYKAQAPMNALQQYMGNISGDYGGTSTQSPSALSSIGQLAGIIGAISDARAKENITPVGKYKGLNVYDFNYKWSPERHRGLIAQEVEQVKPEAVGEISGLKYIDYGKV